MGFILDYKTTSVLQEEQRKLTEDKSVHKSAINKCRAINRIRSAPARSVSRPIPTDTPSKRHRRTRSKKSPQHVSDVWLGKRLSKMSIESTSISSEDESEEELFRPFSGKPRPKPGSSGASSCSGGSDKRGDSSSSRINQSAGQARSQHRINTSVIKNGFWSVLSHNRNNTPTPNNQDEQTRRCSMANAARDILVEQRVIKLFRKVDQLKQTDHMDLRPKSNM
ncbi:hypothetical protein ACHWQZ_G011196 [Mnemiopsis leidyi]